MKTTIPAALLAALLVWGAAAQVAAQPDPLREDPHKPPSDPMRVEPDSLMTPHSVLVPPEGLPAPELDMAVHATVDLAEETAAMRCTLANRLGRDVALDLITGATETVPRRIALASEQSLDFQQDLDVAVTQLSPGTRLASVQPELKVADADDRGGLEGARVDLDVRVHVPQGTRIVRSSVPLTAAPAGWFVYERKGVATFPTVRIWYTAAPEQVAMTTSTQTEGDTLAVDVTLRNDGLAPAEVALSTDFPRKKLQPLDGAAPVEPAGDDPDQTTLRMDGITLDAGATRTVQLRFRRLTDAAPPPLEILLLNTRGDLLQVG